MRTVRQRGCKTKMGFLLSLSNLHWHWAIDKNLTFKDQIDYATSKAESALNSISSIIKLTKTELALMLSKCLATVHIERTFPAWCSTKANLKPIEQLYRRVLVRSTGAMSSTATADLEVFCNTLPCQERLTEVVLLEYAQTCVTT